MSLQLVQTNFASGILNPELIGRTDTAIYNNGLALGVNLMPLIEGGVRRRPGSIVLRGLGLENGRIEPFIFDETQTYLFYFLDAGVIKVFDPSDGELLATLQNAAATGRWSLSQVFELRMDQRGDTMLITHESIRTQKVVRTGASSFTIGDFIPTALPRKNVAGVDPQMWPFYRFADLTWTLTASIAAVANTMTVKDSTGATVDYMLEVPNIEGTFIRVAVLSGTTWTTYWGQVTGIPTNYSFHVTWNDVFPTTAALENWWEQAWCDDHGHPACVAFHNQRLFFAGSTTLPSHIWGSRTSQFFDFDTGEADPADALSAAIGMNQVNQIRHLHSERFLQVLTNQAVMYAPEDEAAPLIPETFRTKRAGRIGVSNTTPVAFDESTVFVQARGNTIRELQWDEFRQTQSAPAISLMSTDVIDDPVDAVAVYASEDRPEQFIYFVNGDGTIALYHAAKAEEVRGWYQWTTNGKYKSITQINDEVYAVVERTLVDGVTKHYFLEKFDFEVTLDKAHVSDQPIETTNHAVPIYPDMPHTIVDTDVWEDTEEVTVVASKEDGSGVMHNNVYPLDEWNLQGSAVNLQPEMLFKRVVIGWDYPCTGRLLPVAIEDEEGEQMAERKSIVAATAKLQNALAFSFFGRRIWFRDADDDFSQPPTRFTGHKQLYQLGWDEFGQIDFSIDEPVDTTLLAIVREVEF